MGLVLRKPDVCICENKDADQLRGNREADQRLFFRYTDRTIPLLPKSVISSLQPLLCGCTVRFVSDLVGTPEDRFSQNEAQLYDYGFRGSRLHGRVNMLPEVKVCFYAQLSCA